MRTGQVNMGLFEQHQSIVLYHSQVFTLQWRHNERDIVSYDQPHECSFNFLFRRRSKKNQSSASLAFVQGSHRWPVNSPHKGPVTRKMFSFDDVIMSKNPHASVGCLPDHIALPQSTPFIPYKIIG